MSGRARARFAPEVSLSGSAPRKAAGRMQTIIRSWCRGRRVCPAGFVEMGQQLRQEWISRSRTAAGSLVLAGDGSFWNRTCFGEIPQDGLLAQEPQRRQTVFSAQRGITPSSTPIEEFTPANRFARTGAASGKPPKSFMAESAVRIPLQSGCRRALATRRQQRPLRLIIIAPTRIRKSKSKELYYRDPAYLWTTDLPQFPSSSYCKSISTSWQIEVNHREEKGTLGVGQAQLWNAISVPSSSLDHGCLQCSICWLPYRAFEKPSARKPNCPASQVACRKRPPAFLPGSDHSPPQRNGAAAPIARSASGSKSPIRPWSTLLPLEKM